MTFNLTPWLNSPMRLGQVIAELQDYALWYAHNKIQRQFDDVKPSADTPKLSVQSLALLAQIQKEQPVKGESFDEILVRLTQISQTAPVVTVTLAAIPSEGLKQAIVQWLRDHIDPNVLVAFQLNSALLGGLVVRLGSHIYDWSFRRQIVEQKNRFAEVLNRV
jgi:F0F1-type ATP synthase delta subunit